MQLFDIHAHLDMLEDLPEITLQKAKAAGVNKIITIGTEPSDHEFVLKTAKQFYPDVYCTLGVHPHQGAVFNQEVADFLDKNVTEREVVAVGEIGLDYYYKNSDPIAQKKAFAEQLEIAAQHKLPVEIHTRDAEEDTVQILQSFRGRLSGVIHCFTGTAWLAHQCLDLGLNISISGVVTFKNAEDLRSTVKSLPVDRIHVETDAPFLAPVPLRGQKNVPANVVHTAKFVADLKGIPLEELAARTCENTRQVFTKIN